MADAARLPSGCLLAYSSSARVLHRWLFDNAQILAAEDDGDNTAM